MEEVKRHLKLLPAEIMKIERLGLPIKTGELSTDKPDKADKGGFADILKQSVEKVNTLQNKADAAIEDLVVGESKDVVQTIISMEKADISFRLMMQVRNKIIQAYEEVMRMQV